LQEQEPVLALEALEPVFLHLWMQGLGQSDAQYGDES
jgi:hypothetical protein